MAFDAFLKFEGIDGESTEKGHEREIEVISFHWGITNPERGRTRIADLQVVKGLDLASPAIFDAVCSGEHIKEAQLTIRKAGGEQQEYYKIVMEDVLITSQTPAGNTGGDAIPMEQLSLNFSKAEINYRQQKPDGSLGAWVTSSCSPRPRGA